MLGARSGGGVKQVLTILTKSVKTTTVRMSLRALTITAGLCGIHLCRGSSTRLRGRFKLFYVFSPQMFKTNKKHIGIFVCFVSTIFMIH